MKIRGYKSKSTRSVNQSLGLRLLANSCVTYINCWPKWTGELKVPILECVVDNDGKMLVA